MYLDLKFMTGLDPEKILIDHLREYKKMLRNKKLKRILNE